MHLTIDGYGGDPGKLADEELVGALLDQSPAEIGMVKIAPPYVCRYQPPSTSSGQAQDWGVSGFVLIAESHLSIHTFPARGLVWADIFSCKGFDADRLVERVREAFGLKETRLCLLERGLEYVHQPEADPPPAEDGPPRQVGVAGGAQHAAPVLAARGGQDPATAKECL
jgi:S-adenosylmethionine decarboxylase